MNAVVLCAGYATRLYPLTLDKPKALLPVSGKPLLNYIIEKLEKISEISNIYVVTNDKFYSHFNSWFSNNQNFKKKIKVLNDQTITNETRLGGLGDLEFVMKKENLNDDLMIICGDNLFNYDLNRMVKFFEKKKEPVIAVYDVHDLNEAKKMGVVSEKHGKIVSFDEKPANPRSALCSVGIYIYPAKCIEKINDYLSVDNPRDGPGFLIEYFMNSGDVYSFEIEGHWFDIGSLETYEKAKNMKF